MSAQQKRSSPCTFPAKYSTVIRGALTLINAVSSKVEDAGLYTCLASSPAGEDGKNHWVRVQGDTGCSCPAWKKYLIPPPYDFLSGTWDLMNNALCKLRSEDLPFSLKRKQTRSGVGVSPQLQFTRSFCLCNRCLRLFSYFYPVVIRQKRRVICHFTILTTQIIKSFTWHCYLRKRKLVIFNCNVSEISKLLGILFQDNIAPLITLYLLHSIHLAHYIFTPQLLAIKPIRLFPAWQTKHVFLTVPTCDILT